jgi:ABC-2 type transport system permease protein
MKRPLDIFLQKEIRDLRGNHQVWPGYLLLPGIAVLMPIILLAFLPTSTSGPIDSDVATLLRFADRDPGVSRFPEEQRLARLVVREFGAFFLLIPVFLSAMSAALSIAAEKQQRTLEPILATPLSTRDLVAAKLVAAVGPAVLVTWGAALLNVIGAAVTTSIRFGEAFWPGWAVVQVILVLGPVCAVASALLGMRASTRANDVQTAVQTASLWVMPAGILMVATLGRPALRSLFVGLVAIGLAALICWWLFRRTVRRFEREEILTRWR